MEKESKLKIKLWQLIVVGIAIILCVVVLTFLLKKSNNENDANFNTGNEQNIIEENKTQNEIEKASKTDNDNLDNYEIDSELDSMKNKFREILYVVCNETNNFNAPSELSPSELMNCIQRYLVATDKWRNYDEVKNPFGESISDTGVMTEECYKIGKEDIEKYIKELFNINYKNHIETGSYKLKYDKGYYYLFTIPAGDDVVAEIKNVKKVNDTTYNVEFNIGSYVDFDRDGLEVVEKTGSAVFKLDGNNYYIESLSTQNLSEDVTLENSNAISESEKENIIKFLNDTESNGFINFGNTYSSIEECNLMNVFFSGIGVGVDWNSQEGIAYKNAQKTEGNYDLLKITTTEAKQIYKKYTGKNISENELKQRLKNVTYLEKYDAFYCERSDTDSVEIKSVKGIVNSNGEYVIDLYESYGKTEKYYSTVTLKKNGDSYIFISNIEK